MCCNGNVFFFIAAHSPDNSFLGFVVSGPVPPDSKPLKKKPIGLVYGKDVEFWQVSRDMVSFVMSLSTLEISYCRRR